MANQPDIAPAREDNLLGICQAIGDDFGFNPLWLRIAFGAALYWNPIVVVGTYLGLGVIIAASRLIVRNPRPAAARVDAPAAPEALPLAA